MNSESLRVNTSPRNMAPKRSLITGAILLSLSTVIMVLLLSLSASALYVLEDFEKMRGWTGNCVEETSNVYEGDSALRIPSVDYGDGGILCLAQKVFQPIDLSAYEDCYVRFYLYVDNEDNIGDGSQFELTSSGTCDAEEMTCGINTYDLHSGWNELIYSIAELRGGMRLDAVNFIRIYMFQSGEQTLILDDITIGTAADFGIGEVFVKEKSVLTFDTCDSASTYTDGSGQMPSVYTRIKLEGKGAVGSEADGTYTLTKNFAEPFDMSEYKKSGYIYFWLYVENADLLGTNASFSFRSGEKDMVAWSLRNLVTGWNEVLLKLDDSNIGSGAIDFTSLKSFTLSIDNTGANRFAIDRFLYGYSRDFGIKNADDPPLEGVTQTDTPTKPTSANEAAYKIITVLFFVILVGSAVPVALGLRQRMLIRQTAGAPAPDADENDGGDSDGNT